MFIEQRSQRRTRSPNHYRCEGNAVQALQRRNPADDPELHHDFAERPCAGRCHSTEPVERAHQQSQIDTIVGVRGDLIDALSKEFSGNDLSVKVDAQSGAITFDSTLLFGYNDDKLQDSGKTFLAEFLPKYFSVLLGKDFSPYVAEIIIEGHTDTDGGYMYNLQLSQNRAFAVVSYCLDENNHFLSDSQLEELRVLLTANGRSWSAPIYAADGTVDMQASRRVEIKFRLKDEEMINQIAEMLEETK